MSKFEKSNIEFDDGRYHRANLGFIVLSGDLACEHDLFNMTPEGVGVSFTRIKTDDYTTTCLLYTSPSPRDVEESRMPSSA